MKLGLLICTYNRPEYLKECFDSLRRADIPEGTMIVIVDDYSDDIETMKLIDDFIFEIPNSSLIRKKKNLSIKDSMLVGCEHLFANGCIEVMNLDGDAIVRNDFIEKILEVRERYPGYIATGFHSTTKNKNGTDRHRIIREFEFAYAKETIGGINMCFAQDLYEVFIKPALLRSIEEGGNWDYMASVSASKSMCVKESVIEHIGDISAMGHHLFGEEPDKAHNFIGLHLPNVTLVGVDCVNFVDILKAAEISTRNVRFKDVKILTSLDTNGFEAVNIRHLDSKAEYNKFILKELVNYIDTPYFIIFQADGFLINYKGWSPYNYHFDMIGGRWAWYGDGMECANGGFSWRSKRLHEILRDDENIISTNDRLIKNFEEDHNIGRIYRPYLEKKHAIRFATNKVCDKFSIEAYGMRPPDNKYNGSLGFHGFNVDFSDSKLPYIPYDKPYITNKVK